MWKLNGLFWTNKNLSVYPRQIFEDNYPSRATSIWSHSLHNFKTPISEKNLEVLNCKRLYNVKTRIKSVAHTWRERGKCASIKSAHIPVRTAKIWKRTFLFSFSDLAFTCTPSKSQRLCPCSLLLKLSAMKKKNCSSNHLFSTIYN